MSNNNTFTIKKAVLLSAGLGTRLQPITNNIPKCLVPINGKPLLQIWLENLTQAGIEEFLINSHYLATEVEKFIQASPYREKIQLTYESELLGTLGSLKANREFWLRENVLVAHADNLCFANWSCFFQRFAIRPDNCSTTMMLFESDTPESCGVVTLDEQQRVIEFFEKIENPPTNLANAAIYIFDQSLEKIIAKLPVGADDISLHLLPSLLGNMNTWLNDGYLRDIGTPESLAIANHFMKSRG